MKASEYSNTYDFKYETYPDAKWFSVREKPIKVFGLYNINESEHFIRIPYDVAKNTNEGVIDLNLNTSGGRFTFSTDSPYIVLHAKQPTFYNMPHMPRSGSAGFDLYICDDDLNQVYSGSFLANAKSSQEFYFSLDSRTTYGKKLKYVVNFPLYEKVDDVYIGVAPDAQLDSFDNPYTNDAPIVYYGSSITQGGCVSRPGNAYPAFISRKYHRDFINLGFSGSCKGEQAILDYMSKLKMSIFVCDYDHNAPNEEYLRNTHYNVYETIRKNNPLLPIVLVSKPDILWHPDFYERRSIILDTYTKAINNGDENVYFVDGSTFFEGEYYDACTVDSTHPNDLGHYLMAKYIGATIGDIISKEK